MSAETECPDISCRGSLIERSDDEGHFWFCSRCGAYLTGYVSVE